MLRKLVALVCLLSFLPVTAGAQELASALVPKEVSAQLEGAQSTSAGAKPMMVVAANERGDMATGQTTAPERETKKRPSCSLGEFFDIHFGGYRWLWWAGAAAVLVGIHVAAAD